MKMKHRPIILTVISVMAFGMVSCSGLLVSSDFGFDDYGPSYDYYWPNYGNIYNPPLGYYGPGWNTPPPPPVIVRPQKPQPPNGANRPNFIPSTPSAPSAPAPSQPSRPVMTTPTGQPRPGNMGQAPVQTGGTDNRNDNSTPGGYNRSR